METGWNLGLFCSAEMLAPGQTSPQTTNKNKLYRIKNNCMHAQARANPGQKIQRD